MVKKTGKSDGGSAADSSTIFEKKSRVFGIGQALPPKRDLRHFVRWPKYVRIQRQKRVLVDRLKIPPMINLFSNTIDKNQAAELLRLLKKYAPETSAEKKARLTAAAESKAAGKDTASEKPLIVKSGINHVTKLVEEKRAKLVVIAHDVDPIEIVVWLPVLCRKMGVPFCIIKGKSRLGQIVHKKTATALAITDVRAADKAAFGKIVDLCKELYNDRFDTLRKTWGGGRLGQKSQVVMDRKRKVLEQEEAKRMNL